MTESQPASGIYVLGARDLLIDQAHGFDYEGMQHAIDCESSYVLHADRHFTQAAAMRQCEVDRFMRRSKSGNYLDELHARDRREIVSTDEFRLPVDAQMGRQSRYGNRRGIAGKDACGRTDGIEFAKNAVFDLFIFEHRFGDVSAIGK